MEISNIRFKRIPTKDSLIGFVSFVIDDCFKVSGIGVHKFDDGYVLLYPEKKGNPVAFPITKEAQEWLYNNLMTEIKQELLHYDENGMRIV